MSSLRTAFRSVVALVGLIAVLLGALEHEDLILQGQQATGAAQDVEISRGLNSSDTTCRSAPTDTGTESEFRQEITRDWVIAERVPLVRFTGRVSLPTRDIPTRITAQRMYSRAPAAGIVALRL